MRESRADEIGLGSSRRKEEEETKVQRGMVTHASHTAKSFNMTVQEKVKSGI